MKLHPFAVSFSEGSLSLDEKNLSIVKSHVPAELFSLFIRSLDQKSLLSCAKVSRAWSYHTRSQANLKIFRDLSVFIENIISQSADRISIDQRQSFNEMKQSLEATCRLLQRCDRSVPHLLSQTKSLSRVKNDMIDLLEKLGESNLDKLVKINLPKGFENIIRISKICSRIYSDNSILSSIDIDLKLAEISIELVENLAVDRALKVAKGISDNFKKLEVFVSLVKSLVDQENIEEAIEITHSISIFYAKKEAVQVILKFFIRKGNLDRALEAISWMPPEYNFLLVNCLFNELIILQKFKLATIFVCSCFTDSPRNQYLGRIISALPPDDIKSRAVVKCLRELPTCLHGRLYEGIGSS